MSDKTNDEKLKILQERLNQIKQKEYPNVASEHKQEDPPEITDPQIDTTQKTQNPMSFGWLKYTAMIILIAYGGFYIFKNINFSTFFSSNEVIEVSEEFVLEYNLELAGDNVALVADFEDEELAKSMVSNLKEKGYKCDYFFLPNKSNSTEEVYKVFIGPYENHNETSQWTKNLDGEHEIMQL